MEIQPVNPSGLIVNGIKVLLFLVITGVVIFGIIRLIILFIKLKKLNMPSLIKYYFFMIICILIMHASWFFNMGWYRLFLTLIAFPVIHFVLFAIINGKALLKFCYSSKLKIYTLISYSTFLISYLFFPDGTDIGTAYVFFNLIHNNAVAYIFGILSVISFATHIIISILQIIELIKIKRIS